MRFLRSVLRFSVWVLVAFGILRLMYPFRLDPTQMIIRTAPSRIGPIMEPDRIIISPRVIHLDDYPGVDPTWKGPCPREIPNCEYRDRMILLR
jgi:hypothetical protein